MIGHPVQLADLNDPRVVGLAREIRAQQVETGHRLTRVERKVEELQGAVVAAVGRAGLARAATDRHGKAMGAVRLELEELRARIAALEARK